MKYYKPIDVSDRRDIHIIVHLNTAYLIELKVSHSRRILWMLCTVAP